MSADSSKRQTKQGNSGQIVLPQPVNDPSIIDSVAGFIHEVVPQACQSVLSAAAGNESKEAIIWAKFHTTDYNDPENFLADTECQSDSVPPLLIILGYGSGVQVWGVSGGGEGRELLSYPQGNVRCLQILYSPQVHPSKDPLASKRPLIVIVDNTGPGPQYQTLNFISLRTAEVVKSIKFKTPICDVVCNRKSIVVTFPERIAVFDVLTLDDRLTVTTCYPSPGINPNPVALGPRWLAYCDKKLTTWQRSSGGCEDEGAQSYTATVIHAAKSLGKGLRDLSGSLTGTVPQPTTNLSQPGIVTVIDIESPRLTKHQTGEEDTSNQSNMVAHFVGHTGPIVAMSFDPSGMLLVVADKHGHRFNVFRLHPHPSSPALAAVHHLYILHRGDTTARVQDVTISWDSRWVAVSSLRGTTHVFPITPYGGPVAVRTHTTPHVVNRLSRFERSAGLSDGRGSPEGAASVLGGSPRLPPYPHPVVLAPLAQIRRTPTGSESTESTPAPTVLRLAARFSPPRALLPPRATPPRTPRHQPKPRVADSLFIVSSYGSLVQYDIEPRSPANVPKDKISYDTGIEVSVEAKGEWVLIKPPCISSIQPPLAQGNPLLPPAPLAPTHMARLVETHSPQLHHPAKGQDDRWLSQVEIITHTGPHRRLWMGPQFSFKSLDQSNPSEGDQPEPENIPPRSNPVNMPRRPYLWIESSSGGSVDAPYMTDNSEDDSIHGETRLREDLADAMMDTALHASGGVVEGGEDGQAGGVEGVDKRLERRITQFGLVVPISPVVLPDVRIPIPPPDLASRISSATLREFAAHIAVTASSSRPEEETSISSEIHPIEKSTSIPEQLPLADTVTSSKPVKEWTEVATSTYDSPVILSTPFHVDAQTETSPLEILPPSVSDKSLNTSMIFEPVRLPLTSSSSENSSKVSEHSESYSTTEKSSNNSSSENGSGQESAVKKSEKPGKKSRKKKNDGKDKTKITPILNMDKTSESIEIKTLDSPPLSEVKSNKDSEKLIEEEKKSDSEQFISEAPEIKSEISGESESTEILEEKLKLPLETVNVKSGDNLIMFTPSDEAISPILEEPETVSDVPSTDLVPEEMAVPPQVEPEDLFYIEEAKAELSNVIVPVVPLETSVSKSMIELKDPKPLEKLKESDITTSLSVSFLSKKEGGRSKKKKKKDDSSKNASSKDSSSKTTLSKGGSSKTSLSKDESSKTTSSKDESSKTTLSIDESSKNTLSKDGSSEIASFEDGSSKTTLSKEETTLSKDGSSEIAPFEDGSSKTTVSKDESYKAVKSKDEVSTFNPEESCSATVSSKDVGKLNVESELKVIDSELLEEVEKEQPPREFEEDQVKEVEVFPSLDLPDVVLTKVLAPDLDSINTLSGPLLKLETSSDEDKASSKESEESKVESTESTESSGKEFKPVVSRKKGKSGKKNKSQVPLPSTETNVKLEKLEVKEEMQESPQITEQSLDIKSVIEEQTEEQEKKKIENDGKEIEIINECNIEKDIEDAVSTIVQSEVVETTSESVSAIEENSDQVSTREETTSDNINKSDSEFFVPIVEKRKKKRKSVKEKDTTHKVECKESPLVKEEVGKKDDGALEVRRSRRESRGKAKSPSPSPKGDIVTDSESSDEAVLTEPKPLTPKLPKRKKPSKRSDTSETREIEIDCKIKQDGTSDIDYETCSEKKSDSSGDSFFDRIRTIDPFSKSWSGLPGDDKTNVEDRDSVYESCNDDEFSGLPQAVVETLPEPLPTESGSSMTEDKTDSGDKDTPGTSQNSSKKPKKQKKKKR